jgi:predicted dehydrogenase
MTFRLAILGYGFIADLHARAARDCGLTIAVVAGHRPASAAEFAATHGALRSTDDWLDAVKADDVDGVVIGTPNALHHPQAMAAIAVGKHVLVEKPMAVTPRDAEEMESAATARGVTLLVGHRWRYREEVTAVRERIAAGTIGRPVRTRGYGIHAGWGPRGWFTDPELAGGGALIDMGIHAIDTARFVLGDPLPVRVVASLGTAYGEYRVDDDGIVLIDWSNGVRSVVECGWWQPRLDGVEADTEIHGTDGYERIWPQYTPQSPPALDYVHCTLPMYTAQMADFVACSGSRGMPRASSEVGRVALDIVAAAYASAAGTR